LAGVAATSTAGCWVSATQATLDNGFVRYQVAGVTGCVSARDVPADFYTAIYGLVTRENGVLVSKCRLRISSSTAAPQ